MERDASELQDARSRAPEPMQDIFVQMQLAKRQQALGRSAVDDLMIVGACTHGLYSVS